MKLFTTNSSYKIVRYSDNGTYPELTFAEAYDFELKEYDIITADSEEEIIDVIFDNPEVDAIVTYSKEESTIFKYLCEHLSIEYKKKWYHFNDYDKNVGTNLATYINYSQVTEFPQPFFSITTPLYKTNEQYFKWALDSLRSQTFNDWEWVLMDDSPEPMTWVLDYIRELKELRVKYFRMDPITKGCIGRSKWRANCMTRGKWLLEFDHDDMIPWWGLQELKTAIDMYPDAGFIYTDDAPIDGECRFQGYTYGDEYGLGYAYPYITYDPTGKYKIVTNRDPNQNFSSMRHIVGVPNHIRCWKREVYFKVGGHNIDLRIADDFELIIRTFLETKFIHVNAPCYFQRFDGNNSQDSGNNRKDIQRRVRLISDHYNEAIHKKFLEYGYNEEDYVPNSSFDTMHRYYGMEDLPKVNYEYTPKWLTTKLSETAKVYNANKKEWEKP